MKTILFLLVLMLSYPAEAETDPLVERAMKASVKVRMKYVTGSGVAIKHYKGGTLIASNDHVCQWSRGKHPLLSKPNYKKALNTYSVSVVRVGGRKYFGKIVYLTNASNPTRNSKYKDDLCLIYIPVKIPTVPINSTDLDMGSKIISVSAPHGLFPLITSGFIGAWTNPDVVTASLHLAPGSSGSGVFSAKTGKLVGIAYAIHTTSHDDVDDVAALYSFLVPVTRVNLFLNKYLERQKKKKRRSK